MFKVGISNFINLYFRFLLFLILEYILLLLLLNYFANSLGVWSSQEMQYVLACQCPSRNWGWSCHEWLHAMPFKLRKALPLFINFIVQECQVVSGLLHNFTRIKVKEVSLTEWTSHFQKKYPSVSKMIWWSWHYYSNNCTA